MKEQIEAKIKEVIDFIISKDPKDITYNEYRILDSKLASIKYEEETKKKNEELSNMIAKTFSSTLGTFPPTALPDLKEE